MEQNKLESVHALLCDAIAHHFPDWKERSRVSYEIAFMLKKYMNQNDCTIGIANNQLVFFHNKSENISIDVNKLTSGTKFSPMDVINSLKNLMSK